MGDVFKEQLVKRQGNTKDTIKKALIIVSAMLISLISLLIPILQSFFLFIVAGLCFGAYYLLSLQNVEFEYIYTNGELDIDIIQNKSKRKRIFNGFVKDFEIMAHLEDKVHEGDFSTATGVCDYSSGVVKPNSYAFLTTYKGKKLKIIIEPNETMLQAFSTVLTPRKLFKK